MKILVVDDDAIYGEMVRRRLETLGHVAEFFQGPFGTLFEIRERKPDLLVIDVRMPGLPGDVLVGLLESSPTSPRPVVILHSAMAADELEKLAERTHADGWVSKTAPKAELLTKVASLLLKRATPAKP